MNTFKYGLRARPFNSDPALANKCGNFNHLLPDEIAIKFPKVLEAIGDNARHGMIVLNVRLEDEFISKHELIDINKLINKEWLEALKVIDYLIKKNSYNKFQTDSFYEQIRMTKETFLKLCVSYDYKSENDVYAWRYNEVNS